MLYPDFQLNSHSMGTWLPLLEVDVQFRMGGYVDKMLRTQKKYLFLTEPREYKCNLKKTPHPRQPSNYYVFISIACLV